jgi:glucan 1,3-beta-glucosidase
MREGARPSPANQARVLHEGAAAAKKANASINLFEGLDQGWRTQDAGAAAAHWGLVDSESGLAKFRWGAPVSDHPPWFVQAVLGVMLAFVVFAAGFLAARSIGPLGPQDVDWFPVAVIALAAGLFVGWAAEQAPLQVSSAVEAAYAGLLLLLAAAAPPVVAAAVVRRVPFESFAGLLDASVRRASPPLARATSVLFVAVVVVAIQLALGLVFDPATRELPAAALTGPAIALFALGLYAPGKYRRGRIAEAAAAYILAGAAPLIAFNESLSNWQALWFAAILLILALACWRARGAPD